MENYLCERYQLINSKVSRVDIEISLLDLEILNFGLRFVFKRYNFRTYHLIPQFADQEYKTSLRKLAFHVCKRKNRWQPYLLLVLYQVKETFSLGFSNMEK